MPVLRGRALGATGLTLAEVPTRAGPEPRHHWLPFIFLVPREGHLQRLRVVNEMVGGEGTQEDGGKQGGQNPTPPARCLWLISPGRI